MSSSAKIRVRLVSGRALVCFVDCVKRPPGLPVADTLADLIPELEGGAGIYVIYPDRVYLPNRQIEAVTAVDPATALGWEGDVAEIESVRPEREPGVETLDLERRGRRRAVGERGQRIDPSRYRTGPGPGYDFTGEIGAVSDAPV